MLDPAKPPATWYEMVPTLAALVGSGSDCALTIAWPASALLENMAAWHNQAFADRAPDVQHPPCGALGVDARDLAEVGLLHLRRRAATRPRRASPPANARCSPPPRRATPSCAAASEVRPRHRAVSRTTTTSTARRSTRSARGAALWVLAGRPHADYAGVARFLAFFAQPEVQAEWHQRTGLVPLIDRRLRAHAQAGLLRGPPRA